VVQNALDVEYSVLLKNRQEGEAVAIFEKYMHKDREHWRLVTTKNFDEWANITLRGKYRFNRIEVDADELEHSPQVWMELRRRALYNEMHHGSLPTNSLKRLQVIFENEVDAIHFKMRWL
jgi:hypothetical protein